MACILNRSSKILQQHPQKRLANQKCPNCRFIMQVCSHYNTIPIFRGFFPLQSLDRLLFLLRQNI